VVCDAGPLIHLHEVGCLHLLADFQKVIVPHGVENEVVRYRRINFAENDIAWLLVPARLPLERSINTICTLFALDSGEVEAISILTHEPDALFLTDDAAARIVAGKLGYQVHGTIGILVRAIRRDLLEPEEVIETLERNVINFSRFFYSRGRIHFYVLVCEDTCAPAGAVRWT
jgi:predicted nucleic acid-binding protein